MRLSETTLNISPEDEEDAMIWLCPNLSRMDAKRIDVSQRAKLEQSVDLTEILQEMEDERKKEGSDNTTNKSTNDNHDFCDSSIESPSMTKISSCKDNDNENVQRAKPSTSVTDILKPEDLQSVLQWSWDDGSNSTSSSSSSF